MSVLMLEVLLFLQLISYTELQEETVHCGVRDPLDSPYKYHKTGHFMIGVAASQTSIFANPLTFKQYHIPHFDSIT